VVPLLVVLLLQSPASDPASAVERLRSLEAAVRRAAEKELSEAGARAAPWLRKALAREGEPIEPRVDALVRRLASTAWKERDDATRALVRLGRAARPRLQAHENAPDVEVAWRVKSILAELKELEPAEILAAAHADAAACRLLGAAGDASSAALILEAAQRADAAPPEAALDLRQSAVGALADLRASLSDEQAAQAAEEGVKLLREPRTRRTVSVALRSLGRLKSPSGVAPIAALLADPAVRDLHLKRAALAALAAIDRPESTRLVLGGASSAEPYVREAALQVLASMGAPAEGIEAAAGPPSEDESARLRAWWEKKHGQPWDGERR
jgi:hypothetical protein